MSTIDRSNQAQPPDPAPKCPHCDQSMHCEGEQGYTDLGYAYWLYTCETPGCPRNGFTYSFGKHTFLGDK